MGTNTGTYQLREFVGLLSVVVLTLTLACCASLLIPVIQHQNTFAPHAVDYLRTFILAAGSAFLVSYLYRLVDVMLIFCKVWVEFLALLLLAYPQKTQMYTASSWNLVRRQAFLFGVFYQVVYLIFYLWDLWYVELNEEQLIRLAKAESAHDLHRQVIQQSTLSNCIDIRRKSNSLKKVIYSTENQNLGVPTETEQLLKDDLFDLNYDTIIEPPENTLEASTHSAVMTSVVSRGSIPYEKSQLVDFRWIGENSLWILLTTLYEIGISLILSITFIYSPDLDDALFTFPEMFYYNRINLFCVTIVVPLFILTSLVQTLLHVAIKPHQKRTTLIAFGLVSMLLFVLGLLAT